MSRFAFQSRQQSVAGRAQSALQVLDTRRTRLLLIIAAVILGISYLWLVNSSATAGFYLSDLESQVVLLEDEYRSLELEKTALGSLEYIQEQSESLELISAGRAEYVSADSAIALNGRE